jgi:NAD(P)-dependent dehydrogenase (short-subunit alcohol dehydrogenase family)
MDPKPDHGEKSYRGSCKLSGKRAVITGADSGIGRAVAIAFAREGADVLIAYLKEHHDAKETRRLVEEAGSKAVLLAATSSRPHIAARLSRPHARNSAASKSWSTMRRTRQASSRSRISRMRNGS